MSFRSCSRKIIIPTSRGNEQTNTYRTDLKICFRESLMKNRHKAITKVRLRVPLESSEGCFARLTERISENNCPLKQTAKLQMKSDDLLMKGGAAPA